MSHFALAVVVALLAAPGASARSLRDPIPEQPIAAGVGLELTELTRLPQSNTFPGPPSDQRLVRWNRINYLGEVPDGSRLYVPDLNGKLYMIEDGAPREYLDVGATFAPACFSQRGLGQGFGFVTFDPGFARNGRFYTVHVEQASLATTPPDLPAQRGLADAAAARRCASDRVCGRPAPAASYPCGSTRTRPR